MKMDSEQKKRGMQVLQWEWGPLLLFWAVSWAPGQLVGGVITVSGLSPPALWGLGTGSVSLAGREVVLCSVCINLLNKQHCCFSLSPLPPPPCVQVAFQTAGCVSHWTEAVSACRSPTLGTFLPFVYLFKHMLTSSHQIPVLLLWSQCPGLAHVEGVDVSLLLGQHWLS